MNLDIKSNLASFEQDGLVIIPNVINTKFINKLREELEKAIAEDAIAYPNVFDKGMVHNCMFRGQAMAELLDCPEMNKFVAEILSPTFIIYAYQSSSLKPNHGNYGSRIHVDSPRYIPDYPTNIGVIFPLDDFTLENGATFYLPKSHKQEKAPDEETFYKFAKRAECNAGDLIIFHGRMYHAAGQNFTDVNRHSITINFCRSYMRQRFDYARMVSEKDIVKFSDNTKKLLGWNVRVPTHLSEFYLPENQRLYKPNQG